MGFDRFVNWTTTTPTFEEIRWVLEDYLGEAGIVTFEADADVPKEWLWITLRGAPSYPLKRVAPEHAHVAAFAEMMHDPRTFEIFVGEDHISVITRMSDEYTKVVAEGFANLAARWWKGRREET